MAHQPNMLNERPSLVRCHGLECSHRASPVTTPLVTTAATLRHNRWTSRLGRMPHRVRSHRAGGSRKSPAAHIRTPARSNRRSRTRAALKTAIRPACSCFPGFAGRWRVADADTASRAPGTLRRVHAVAEQNRRPERVTRGPTSHRGPVLQALIASLRSGDSVPVALPQFPPQWLIIAVTRSMSPSGHVLGDMADRSQNTDTAER